MNHIFFHRSDFDGKCSGAIARLWSVKNNEEWYLYPFSHECKIPIENIDKEKDAIFFLDVVMENTDEMRSLINQGYNITICDHHQTFLDTGIHKLVRGNCSLLKSGCELSWEYFFPNKKMPETVHLMGRYDCWDMSDKEKWEKRILPLQYGMRNRSNSIIDDFGLWEALLIDKSEILEHLIEEGKLLCEYQKNSYKSLFYYYYFSASFAEFPEYRLLCLNSPGGSSALFESKWDEELYDAMFAFAFNGKVWNCSIYSTKKDLDFSKIAWKFGGGGHKSACGFQALSVEVKNGEIYIDPTVKR